MSHRVSQRPVVAGLAGLTVALSGLAVVATATPASAVSPDLVISEVYGGGGNSGATFTHDYIELYNRGDAPVSLDGTSLQYASATGTGNFGASTTQLTELSGTLEPGQYFLVQEATGGAAGGGLPTPDITDASPINMSGSAGKVALVDGVSSLGCNGGSAPCDAAQLGRIIDLVGFGSANFFEGSGAAPTLSNTTAAIRVGAGEQDTDDNAADFTASTPDPQNSGAGGDELAATDPADVNAIVGTAITPFTLQATGGTPSYSWELTGLPAGLSGSTEGEVSGTPTEEGTFPVTATVTDSASPTPANDSVEFTVTVAAELEPISIAEIQGTGAASELVGETVLTEGVVTAKYPGGSGQFNGIYLQTAGSGGDTDDTPGASDAIFVFGNNSQPADVEIGDSVQVTGVVSEFNGLTEITPSAGGVVEVASLGEVTPRNTVPGTDCALPGSDCLTGADLNAAREATEGELFQPTGDYTVTDVHDGSAYNGSSFSSNMFGEVGLAAESEIPLVTPTEVIDAQATADINARKAYNDAHRMILDDGAAVTYWNTSNTGQMDQPFPWFTEDNQVRVGAAVTFPQPVVMEWRNNTWKLQPQMRVTDSGSDRVAFEQDRPDAPEDVGGDLKLGTFNVLNYFTTLGVDYGGCDSFDDREGNPIAVDDCGPTGPRGAWDETSFERQETKIVAAINTMDADIMALEEIENSGIVDGGDRDEAVETLVAALNADAGTERWAYVDSPAAVDPGEDVIRTAMIYNPATVELVGGSELFYDPAFDDAREPFAQAFKAAGGDDEDGFAVIANHFKSKGSGNPDPDGQGNANDRRMLQATALAGFADDFSASQGVEKVFLTGDFNAYSMEDPVQILNDAGYTSLESTDDPEEESYNFDGMIGSLDHVFANAAAAPDVTGVDIWTINAYESQYYEYSRFNYNIRQLYSPEPFRASDHNPELVGIDVPEPKPAGTIDVKVTPNKVKVDKTEAKLHIEVSGPEGRATGFVVVSVAGQPDREVTLKNGKAQVRLDAFDSVGDKVVTIEYSGDDVTGSATETVTIQVVS